MLFINLSKKRLNIFELETDKIISLSYWKINDILSQLYKYKF